MTMPMMYNTKNAIAYEQKNCMDCLFTVVGMDRLSTGGQCHTAYQFG